MSGSDAVRGGTAAHNDACKARGVAPGDPHSFNAECALCHTAGIHGFRDAVSE
jgi:hypothetical protein